MIYQHFELICGCPETLSPQTPDERMSLSDALEEVFPAGTGLCVMQWNGLFVPLSYKYDVSWILADALDMVERFDAEQEPTSFNVSFPSNTFRVDWRVVADEGTVSIDPVWHSVLGGLSELLRERSPLSVPLSSFLAEWRHLFAVVLRAIQESGLRSEYVDDYDRLVALSQLRLVGAEPSSVAPDTEVRESDG